MIRCGSCGEENPPRARFCLGCAAPLASRDAGRETRRIVTVLFADLVGSTAIGERLDPETFRSIQTRYFAALRGAIESHGGTVEKYIGDAVMAVFGLPTLHAVGDMAAAYRCRWDECYARWRQAQDLLSMGASSEDIERVIARGIEVGYANVPARNELSSLAATAGVGTPTFVVIPSDSTR